MPTQIKEAMVLWYDIARQGCTNENMAENPILRDLSGNGHDATCYNFNWNDIFFSHGGIGAYNYYAINSYQFVQTGGIVTYSANHTKATITKAASENHVFWQYYIAPQTEIRIKIKITGLSNSGFTISGMSLETQEDGEYFLVATNTTDSAKWYGLRFDIDHLNQPCNITIEQLTIYPHALISNGVDSYCIAEGLPILTDFTVFAKRKYISMVFNSALLSKRDDVNFSGNYDDNIGAFQLERNNSEERTIFSFGKSNEVAIQQQKDIVYLTANSYNGNPISKGDAVDTSTLNIFNFGSVGHNPCSNVALYSVILFNRTLTPEEIEWVKRNLV